MSSENSKILEDFISKAKTAKETVAFDKKAVKRLKNEFRKDSKKWLLELVMTSRANKSELSNKIYSTIFKMIYPKVFCTMICLTLFSRTKEHTMHTKYTIFGLSNSCCNVRYRNGNMSHVSRKFIRGNSK